MQPTVFSHVSNDMTIAREEIFGPVLVMIGYDDDDDAVRIANDTLYGLSGYISGSSDRANAMARRIRSGNVHVNGAGPDFNAPFGGYRQSGQRPRVGSARLRGVPRDQSHHGCEHHDVGARHDHVLRSSGCGAPIRNALSRYRGRPC